MREPFPSEIRAFERRFGYAPTLLNVADGSYDTRGGTHAIAIYVNAANPLPGLTLAQLKALFTGRRAHGALRTWGQLGLRGRWTDRPIHLYGMMPRRASGNPPGIVNYLEHRVLHGAAFRADLRVQVDRPGESALQAIVRRVASDPDGVGYSGFGYALPGVRTVPLAARAGQRWRRGTPANVASRRYPLSRRIYFLLNVVPGKPLPARLGAFLDYVLSAAGQRQVAHCAEGFLPLTMPQRRRARRQLAHLMHRPVHAAYLTRSGAITIVGYNDMRQMLLALDRLFERTHPHAHFALRLEGTRTAPAALAAGRSLFAPMGAPFLPRALTQYRRIVGDAPIGIPIARLARSAGTIRPPGRARSARQSAAPAHARAGAPPVQRTAAFVALGTIRPRRPLGKPAGAPLRTGRGHRPRPMPASSRTGRAKIRRRHARVP